MRPIVACAAALLLAGCTAPVGDTALTLHQRAVFPDGTSYALSELKMSERDSGRSRGSLKTPGPEVTVWVEVANRGEPLRGSDVRMQLAYANQDNEEIRAHEIGSSYNVVPRGGRDRVSKTFLVPKVSEVFQTRYIRVVFEAPNYPSVTFSGSNP